MARKARIKSSTGIYHVLVRAISDLSLFSDEEDRQFYIDILNYLQHQGRCEVYAYALFPTHVHLLLKEGVPESSKVQVAQENSKDIKFTENYFPLVSGSATNLAVNSRKFTFRQKRFIVIIG